MRLIDADALMKKIREVDFMADAEEMKVTHDTMMTGFFHGRVQGIVDHLPTAYDPEKVVEHIHDYFKGQFDIRYEELKLSNEVPIDAVDDLLSHNKAVCNIVEKGGVE